MTLEGVMGVLAGVSLGSIALMGWALMPPKTQAICDALDCAAAWDNVAQQMETSSDPFRPHLATAGDAHDLAVLLHDFNTEFGTPSPGVEALASRLAELLAANSTFAIVAGSPAGAVALVTLRTNVWCTGLVALLDEMYVVPPLRGQGIGSALIDQLLTTCVARDVHLIEINVDEGDADAQRFYERNGFSMREQGSEERAFYFFQELTPSTGSPSAPPIRVRGES